MLAWSLTNGLSFPFNYYFAFLVMTTTALLALFFSFRLTRSRVSSGLESADEAKGLMDAWQETNKSKKTDNSNTEGRKGHQEIRLEDPHKETR